MKIELTASYWGYGIGFFSLILDFPAIFSKRFCDLSLSWWLKFNIKKTSQGIEQGSFRNENKSIQQKLNGSVGRPLKIRENVGGFFLGQVK